ncbi:MAG TPA: MASE1 domain-containing protein [Vicinamibacterales bacterium]|nr:MASE1 domain-containing protein [Vicinamibacterales bacterium]
MLERTASSTPEIRVPERLPPRAREGAAATDPAPWWASPLVRDIGLNVIVAAAYWLVAELTLIPTTAAGRVTPMWPAAGIAVAAVLLGGNRLLPGIIFGSVALMAGRVPFAAAIVVAVGVALEAVIDVYLLRRFKFDLRLERVRDPLILCAVATVGAAVDAGLGATAMYVVASPGEQPTVYGWFLWWLRDWLGVQIFLPLILTWRGARERRWPWPRGVEALALAVACQPTDVRVVGDLSWAACTAGVPLLSARRLCRSAFRSARRVNCRRRGRNLHAADRRAGDRTLRGLPDRPDPPAVAHPAAVWLVERADSRCRDSRT